MHTAHSAPSFRQQQEPLCSKHLMCGHVALSSSKSSISMAASYRSRSAWRQVTGLDPSISNSAIQLTLNQGSTLFSDAFTLSLRPPTSSRVTSRPDAMKIEMSGLVAR